MDSEILIKGMVCRRCVSVIRHGISSLGYEVDKISLGKLSFNVQPDQHGLSKIAGFLSENGFEMISDRQLRVVNRVKEIINDVFGQSIKYDSKLKFSNLLAEA